METWQIVWKKTDGNWEVREVGSREEARAEAEKLKQMGLLPFWQKKKM